MKDNKGFTLIEILAVVIILGIIIIIAIPFFTGSLNVFRDDYYKNLSDNVRNAGQEFFNDNRLYLPHNLFDASNVKISDLIGQKYLNEVKDYNGKNCDLSSSYVIAIRKGKDAYEYTTCMKCSEDDYDTFKGNANCSSAWIDGFKMTKFDKADTVHLPVGVAKDKLKKEVVAYPTIMRCAANDPTCANPIARISAKVDDYAEPIYPISLDKVNTKVAGTYEVEYKYENSQIVKGYVVIFQEIAPTVSFTKAISPHNNTITGGTTNKPDEPYDPDTSTDWAYSMKITFTVTLDPNVVGEGVSVSRYQRFFNGRWEDYCKNISGSNNECVADETQEMNENVKFRYVDTEGNISAETRIYNMRIDRTKPSCTLKLKGAIGEDNWHTEYTEIQFNSKSDNNGVTPYPSATNPKSGIKRFVITKDSLSNTKVVEEEDTTNVKWYGFVEDYAYNFAICEIEFKQDTSVPTCELQFAGTAGTSPWYKAGSNVTISFKSKTDETSGIQAHWLNNDTSKDVMTRSTSTGSSGVTYTGHVKNGAGLTNTCTKKLKYDKDIPTCSTSKSNLNTTAGVTVSFTCDNNTGGSATACPSSKTGVKSSTTYTVTDAAGNSNTCSVSVSNKKQKGTGACTNPRTCDDWSFGSHDCNPHDCSCSDCKTTTEDCEGGYDYSYQCAISSPGSNCTWVSSNSTACNSMYGYDYWKCSTYNTCKTTKTTCHYGCDTCYDSCPNSGTDAATCGCNGYAAGSGWKDDANCSESTTNTLKTYCRTVYY